MSYTTFKYEACPADTVVATGKSLAYQVKVTNTGSKDGDEVVQLYISHSKQKQTERMPLCALKGFQRVSLKKGETKTVTFTLSPEELALVTADGLLRERAGKAKSTSVAASQGQVGRLLTVAHSGRSIFQIH